MEVFDRYQNASAIHQQIAIKKSELAAIDKKEEQKSLFEKNDTVNITGSEVDENDYQRVLEKFKQLDAQTRAHEQQHAADKQAGRCAGRRRGGPTAKGWALPDLRPDYEHAAFRRGL